MELYKFSRLVMHLNSCSMDLGRDTAISHLGAIKSDHTAILLDSRPTDSFAHRPFRFEVAWTRDPRCYEVIDNAWSVEANGSELIILCKRQEATRSALRKWNKEVFEKCQDKISTILREVKLIQYRDSSDNNGSNESKLQAKLSEWLIRSEILWRQKSRKLWLKHGDKKSKFFHLSTNIQRRRNNIDAIKVENGSCICESSQIWNHFLKGFKSVFSIDYASFPTNLENLITPAITQEENDILSCIPSLELIKQTLFQMQDLKAFGPDGFPAVFYIVRLNLVNHLVGFISCQICLYFST